MKKIKWIVAFAFLALLIIVPNISKAADLGIQISPLSYNFEIEPGQGQEVKITVTNTNITLLNYIVEIENFDQVNNEGAPSFSGTSSDSSVTTLKDWISITDKSLAESTIFSKEAKTLTFDISVPEGAEPGGHYAAIFVKEIKKNAEGKTEIGISSRVGALVLVTVPGDLTKTAEITKFNPPKFVWHGPVKFDMTVKNTGTTHYDSKSTVELASMFGSKQIVELGLHTIIPKNERDYSGEWSNKYPFGYYKVKGIATDGDGNPVQAESVIWAIPLIIVIPVLVGLILLVWIITYLGKHVKFVPNENSKK